MIYHIGITQCKWDNKIDLNKLWVEYERIIKEHGVICLFSQTKFFYELIKSNEKLFRYDLIWDKVLVTGFLNANRQPLRRHEQIAIFYLVPLFLAIIHSIFGIIVAGKILQVFGKQDLLGSIIITAIFIIVIYGGYFLITYYCSKNIIKEKRI